MIRGLDAIDICLDLVVLIEQDHLVMVGVVFAFV